MAPTQRLDRWLWCARFVKSRALATKLCAAGAVGVGAAATAKPAHPLRVGDRVRLRLGRFERELEVTALALRRGPAAEARTLYRELARTDIADAPWEPILAEADEEG